MSTIQWSRERRKSWNDEKSRVRVRQRWKIDASRCRAPQHWTSQPRLPRSPSTQTNQPTHYPQRPPTRHLVIPPTRIPFHTLACLIRQHHQPLNGNAALLHPSGPQCSPTASGSTLLPVPPTFFYELSRNSPFLPFSMRCRSYSVISHSCFSSFTSHYLSGFPFCHKQPPNSTIIVSSSFLVRNYSSSSSQRVLSLFPSNNIFLNFLCFMSMILFSLYKKPS